MAKDITYRLIVNGEQVNRLTEEHQAILSERLSTVVTQYFRTHNDEFENYLKRHGGKNDRERKA